MTSCANAKAVAGRAGGQRDGSGSLVSGVRRAACGGGLRAWLRARSQERARNSSNGGCDAGAGMWHGMGMGKGNRRRLHASCAVASTPMRRAGTSLGRLQFRANCGLVHLDLTRSHLHPRLAENCGNQREHLQRHLFDMLAREMHRASRCSAP